MSQRYLNRELSWLDFNFRVLKEAEREDNRLLDRVKFLAITGSNLDEFFMVRAGGLKLRHIYRKRKRDLSGLTLTEQIEAVYSKAREMAEAQEECYKALVNELTQNRIIHVRPEDLTHNDMEYLRDYVETELWPVLTPEAVSIEDAPGITGGLINHLGVSLVSDSDKEEPDIAFIPLQAQSGRTIILPSEDNRYFRFIFLEEVTEKFIERWFEGREVQETAVLRITRNADIALQEDEASDLLTGMEEILRERKSSGCVRLEVEQGASKEMTDFLKSYFGVEPHEVFRSSIPLNLKDLFELSGIQEREDLREDGVMAPLRSASIPAGASVMDVLSEKEILLYHPYESFDPVVKFIQEAAEDPDVLAIKQVLYRTSSNSPVIKALKSAALNGKNVTVLIELKARFDEARNIKWAKALEESGVQVVYGVKKLKTHAKICLVVKREHTGIVRYCHFGTGNYNDSTAKLYCDIGYMTTDEDLGMDASSVFNAVAGYSVPGRLRKLSMAPFQIKNRLKELIAYETECAKRGKKSYIKAKLNGIVDKEIIDELYTASYAGVRIELNVRGICCLVPGVSGLSENIRVISIVDRFLEHARIVVFHHSGEELVYISSADWMPRNLDKRVELLIPVTEKKLKNRITTWIELHLSDNLRSWTLTGNGTWKETPVNGKRIRSQEEIYKLIKKEIESQEKYEREQLVPHKPKR